MVKNGHDLSDHGAVKQTVSQELVYGILHAGANSGNLKLFQRFLGECGQKWKWLFILDF